MILFCSFLSIGPIGCMIFQMSSMWRSNNPPIADDGRIFWQIIMRCMKRHETPLHSFMIGRCYTVYWWLVTGAGFLPYDLMIEGRSYGEDLFVFVLYLWLLTVPFLIIWRFETLSFARHSLTRDSQTSCNATKAKRQPRGVPGWCFLCDEVWRTHWRSKLHSTASFQLMIQQGRLSHIVNMCDLD